MSNGTEAGKRESGEARKRGSGEDLGAEVRKCESAKVRKNGRYQVHKFYEFVLFYCPRDMGKYQDLIIFQKADELAFRIYKVSELFPRSELFGLRAQIRRAALSIPTNIVEGYGRKSRKELKQFINISLGSLAETRYLFDFSKRLQYHEDSDKTGELLEEVGRLLWSFYRTL